MTTLLGPRQAATFMQFAASVGGGRDGPSAGEKAASLRLTTTDDKDTRTKLHRSISRLFGRLLESKTHSDRAGTYIDVRVRERRGKKRKAELNAAPCGDSSSDGGGATKSSSTATEATTYTYFCLQKDDREQLNALEILSNETGLRISDFSYAGIKDKRALTLQGMTVRGDQLAVLTKAQPGIASLGLKVGSFAAVPRPLRPGTLRGNRFRVVLRDVPEASMAAIPAAINRVRASGFINYFGTQRFGSPQDEGTSGAYIGKLLLQRDWCGAVKLLLGPSMAETNERANAARELFTDPLEDVDLHEAMALFPQQRTREMMVLRALNRHGVDADGCRRALMAVPHTARSLWVHSYSSLVWNRMATFQVQRHGNVVQPGDLVQAANTAGIPRPWMPQVKKAGAGGSGGGSGGGGGGGGGGGCCCCTGST